MFKHLIALFIVFVAATSTAYAAPNRGGGIVYNKSNCGWPNYRSYAFGGAGSGSVCANWLTNKCTAAVIWSDGGKNWICDSAQAMFSTPYQANERSPEAKLLKEHCGPEAYSTFCN
jgi:hypothetical protein